MASGGAGSGAAAFPSVSGFIPVRSGILPDVARAAWFPLAVVSVASAPYREKKYAKKRLRLARFAASCRLGGAPRPYVQGRAVAVPFLVWRRAGSRLGPGWCGVCLRLFSGAWSAVCVRLCLVGPWLARYAVCLVGAVR